MSRTAQHVFSRIYARNLWHGTESPAGPGSTSVATQALARELPGLMQHYGWRSILDAGCNDSNWMPPLPGYVGVDVVPAAIEKATTIHPDREYLVADITTDRLPRCDVVFCRDALQHLSFADGLAALANFRRSGALWIITSTHQKVTNRNIRTGAHYEINIQEPPFAFLEPEWLIADGTWDSGVRYPHKAIGLWAL